MKGITRLLWLVSISLVLQVGAQATTINVNPSDNGSLYVCTGCNPAPNRIYVTVSGYIVGDIDFSTASFSGSSIDGALLSVNPYALPLFGTTLEVYGVASTSSTISMADLTSPVFIGTWNLPANLGYGDDAFYDVSGFLKTVNTPYVDFILEDAPGGTDTFSSLQENYGHPSQLDVTVPEPASFSLALMGLLAVGSRKFRGVDGGKA